MSPQLPKTLTDRKGERPYFDVSLVPPPSNVYVCWLDLMGAQSIMRRALKTAANFVMKIHVACQAVVQQGGHNVELFPMMDGVYIVASEQSPLFYFLKAVFTKLALEFILADEDQYRFLVRGALAFGPLARGSEMCDASYALKNNPSYCQRIAVGISLAQAYEDERRAPPFGIYMHDTVRSFAPIGQEPLQGIMWRWWRLANAAEDNELLEHLRSSVESYYTWAKTHSNTMLYDPERMEEHLALFREYTAP